MKGIVKGMKTVMAHLVRPSFTEGYPWEPRLLPERSRTSFTLPLDDEGLPYCKSCMLCAKNCADNAIRIESAKRPDGPGRVLLDFEIDLGLCMYCGICVENCPSSGLAHSGDFETASAARGDMTLVLYRASDAARRELEQAAAAAAAAADAGDQS